MEVSLPEPYDEVLNDDDIATINDVNKIFTLIYKGTEGVFPHNLDLKKVKIKQVILNTNVI